MMPRLLVVPNPAPESSAQSSAWVDTAPPGVASSRHGELQDPGRVGRRHDRPHPIEPASAAEPVVDHMPARARGGGRLVRYARRGAGGDRARRRSGLQRRRRPRKLWRSGWNPARDAADAGREMAEAIEAMQAVTIAAVHGHCVGGGVVLAAACDLRIAAESTRFRSQRSTSASRSPGAGSSDWCERSVQLQPANWSSPADRSAPPRRKRSGC